METQEILNYILGTIALLSTIFGVYNYFRKPQEDIELKQAIGDKEMSNKATILAQKEMENKANILAEQFKMRNETTDRRFEQIISDNKEAMTIAQNHIHSTDMRVEELSKIVNMMNLNITNELSKLSTILEERLPKK